MAPESRVLDIPTKSPQSESPQSETTHQLLERSEVVAFADWLDEELVLLEEKFARFRIHRRVSTPLRA